MLLDNGIRLHKIGAQIPERWLDWNEVKEPSLSLLRNPTKWPAQEYIASTIDVTRKFMGTKAQVGNHELWAEIAIDNGLAKQQDLENMKRLLILDGFRDDREVAEIIRTARVLAWDAGILTSSSKVDIFSPESFQKGRLQTVFFPIHMVGANFVNARAKAKGWGYKLIFLRPLPDSELDKAEVGRPHFWRKSGEPVDLNEMKGQKTALVISQWDTEGKFVEDNICVSIPLSVSPSSACREIQTLPAASAASLAMNAILSATQDVPLTQPTGLKPTHSETYEGRMLTKELSKTLNIPRPMSERQQRALDRKRAREQFEKAWEEAESEKVVDDNYEGRELEDEEDEDEVVRQAKEKILKQEEEQKREKIRFKKAERERMIRESQKMKHLWSGFGSDAIKI